MHGLSFGNKVKTGELEREVDKLHFGQAEFEIPLEKAKGNVCNSIECIWRQRPNYSSLKPKWVVKSQTFSAGKCI